MKITAANTEETNKIAKAFIEKLSSNSSHATIVGLRGDLGVGKTTFTQSVARCLGINETVSSPTFVIEKIYKLKANSYKNLIHIDAYRLEKGSELLHLGWKEITDEPNNLIFIEWPEKVEEILPEHMIEIKFTFINESTREIEIPETYA
jgi:tRNA threonylcarbamoyladenosine biosynthesis protein TsaE